MKEQEQKFNNFHNSFFHIKKKKKKAFSVIIQYDCSVNKELEVPYKKENSS